LPRTTTPSRKPLGAVVVPNPLAELRRLLSRATSAFLVVSPTAVTAPDYPARGYAGQSGRLDVVARAAIAASMEEGYLFLGLLLGPPRPPVTLALTSDCVTPTLSERGVMEVFRRLLSGRDLGSCRALELGLEDLLSASKAEGIPVVYLHEEGVDASKAPEAFAGRKLYIAGSHIDIPEELESKIRLQASYVVSVSPKPLLVSHVILYVVEARRNCRGFQG